MKFGGGVILRSSQTTDTSNADVVSPGYALKVGDTRLTVQLNVNNLLDKEFFPSAAFSLNAIEVGAPRTFMGSIRVEY